MAQPDEILADRWALVEKIDEGAMGEIFRATHAVLGHAVAVKVLLPTAARDAASIERFMREARIAAKLQHRNVVRVEDYGVAADGRPFLVMELLRGESLARRLARPPRPTHAETLDVVRQIGAALDAAHAAGIVHRDLKPENVFLAHDGAGGTVVKVLDFGVAKFTDVLANGAHATTSNTLVGTPRYMSPEQARSSRQLDGRSDLWALGMLTYEMLTGALPFEGEAIAELLVAILTHPIPPPSSLRADLPPSLDAWMTVALARSRYERFATGRELADALAEALAGRSDARWTPVAPRANTTPARGTVRMQRPAPASEASAGALVEAPPADADSSGNRPAVDDAANLVVHVVPGDARRSGATGADGARVSWWLAALVAVAAGVSLVLATRALLPSTPVRALPSPMANIAREPARAEVIPDAAAAGEPSETAAPARPDATRAAPAAADDPGETPRTRGRGARHRAPHRHVPSAPSQQAPRGAGGGLYDPTGI